MRESYLGFIFVFASCVLISCSRHHTDLDERQDIQLADSTDDIRVPASLWDLMEGKILPLEKKPEVNFSAAEKSAGYIFVPVRVLLDEKNEGVLKKPHMNLIFARGGGTIDLAEFVTEQKGSYFVKFDLAEELGHSKELKVYFVSGAKKRKIADEVVGAGCNTFFDISKKFDAQFVLQGFKVNTTRDRHISVLGGTFVFSVKKDNQIYISQVTFTDSSNKHLLCEP